jgi:hypothetical protein
MRRGCVCPISLPVCARPRPSCSTIFGSLRCLARAGLAADDHDLMCLQRTRDPRRAGPRPAAIRGNVIGGMGVAATACGCLRRAGLRASRFGVRHEARDYPSLHVGAGFPYLLRQSAGTTVRSPAAGGCMGFRHPPESPSPRSLYPPSAPRPRRPQRRRFLRTAAVAAGATGALAAPLVSRAQTTSLRFQSTWPAKDIFHEYATTSPRRSTTWPAAG